MLAERFLDSASIRHARPRLNRSPDAAETLTSYQWPGNIRELRNIVERLVVLSRSAVVTNADISDLIQRGVQHANENSAGCTNLDEVEADLFRRVIAESPTRREATKKLGIGVNTLLRKKRRHGIL
jgi:DNA-binding NtrC family response regulator